MIRAWIRRRFARIMHPPRRAIPTRAGIFVLGAPVVLGVAAVSASNNLLFVLLGAALGTIVLSGILSERNLRGVEVRVTAPGAVYSGEPTRLEVEILKSGSEEGGAPSFGLRVREMGGLSAYTSWRRPKDPALRLDVEVPVLAAASARSIARRVFLGRGRAELRPCELVTTFPFGLLHKSRDVDVRLEIVVRPRRIALSKELAVLASRADDGEASARRGHGLEIYGLREREDWDGHERVHALRSLTLGRDVVVETAGIERPTACLGVANVEGADVEAFERSLEIASALLTEWDRRGFAVGVVSAGGAVLPGEGTLDAALEHLALLELSPRFSPPAPVPSLIIAPIGAAAPASATIVRVAASGDVAYERAT